MNYEVRQIIMLLVVGAGALVFGLSYCAAYLIGRSHGRAQGERATRHDDEFRMTDRLTALERTIGGVASSVERLQDAQRLLVAQQEHLGRKVAAGIPAVPRNAGLSPAQPRDTPA